MKIGIVGLPNVGKSTLFNSITKAGAECANYPFCTIEPNVGVVAVPDERLEKLAEIYNPQKVTHAIVEFVDSNDEDTSILILSDDKASEKDMDSYALTNLIYVHDIIRDKIKENPKFEKDKIDVIVEILNPKNYDVVYNYNVNNIVISNRYISKMVTQIGEKIELFEFYNDILKYDEKTEESYLSDSFESREIF